jgi:hypothetical protein
MDEFDTLFGDRDAMSSGSHPYASKYLGVMLSEWDGLQEASKAPVLVLAATNRPQDIDQAFLRRLPMSIETKPPNSAGRADILSKMLHADAVAPDVDFKEIASRTKRYTGSDLRELIRLVRLEMMKSLWSNIDDIPENCTYPVVGGESLGELAMISRKHFETGDDDSDTTKLFYFSIYSFLTMYISYEAFSKCCLSGDAAVQYSKQDKSKALTRYYTSPAYPALIIYNNIQHHSLLVLFCQYRLRQFIRKDY